MGLRGLFLSGISLPKKALQFNINEIKMVCCVGSVLSVEVEVKR